MTSIRLISDEIQSIAAGTIGLAYMGIGPAFAESARILVVQNLTDGILMFSFNGIDDHFSLPQHTQFLLSITQNDQKNTEYLALPAGSRLFVKEIVNPATGTVYVTQFRGINDA